MPKGKLRETTVQKIAVDWLRDHYVSINPNIVAIASAQEVRVKKSEKLGNGRADGLIAAQLVDGSIFTASLEAKSSRTDGDINPNYKDNDRKWVLHTIVIGVVMLVMAAFLGWSYADHWFWKWVAPLLVFFLSAFIFMIATHDVAYYRPIGVIKQVKQYPANQQWIALSTDAFNALSVDSRRSLLRDIKKEGIGFVRVSSRSNVLLMESPSLKQTPKGYLDLLSYYSRENDIRNRLAQLKRRTN